MSLSKKNAVHAAIVELNGCLASENWARGLPRKASLEDGWRLCPRADWLLWLLDRAGPMAECFVDQKWVVLASCAVARVALPPPSEVKSEDMRLYVECLVTLDLTEECVDEHARALPYRAENRDVPYRYRHVPMHGYVAAVRFSMEQLWKAFTMYSPYTELVRCVLSAASSIEGITNNVEGLRAVRAFVGGPQTAIRAATLHSVQNQSTWTKFRAWFDPEYPERKFQKDAADAIRAVVPWPVVEEAWAKYSARKEAQT